MIDKMIIAEKKKSDLALYQVFKMKINVPASHSKYICSLLWVEDFEADAVLEVIMTTPDH